MLTIRIIKQKREMKIRIMRQAFQEFVKQNICQYLKVIKHLHHWRKNSIRFQHHYKNYSTTNRDSLICSLFVVDKKLMSMSYNVDKINNSKY